MSSTTPQPPKEPPKKSETGSKPGSLETKETKEAKEAREAREAKEAKEAREAEKARSQKVGETKKDHDVGEGALQAQPSGTTSGTERKRRAESSIEVTPEPSVKSGPGALRKKVSFGDTDKPHTTVHIFPRDEDIDEKDSADTLEKDSQRLATSDQDMNDEDMDADMTHTQDIDSAGVVRSGASSAAASAASTTPGMERPRKMASSESPHREMTSGYNASRATSETRLPGRVAATADIDEKMIKNSYERIKKNIKDAVSEASPNEIQSLYKETKLEIVTDDLNNLKVRMHYDDGKKVDEISRSINPETQQMTAVLSRNAEDKSFLLFCDINKEFAPLQMKPCGDAEIALKVLEASVKMNVKIELSDEDKTLFSKPENASLKAHFELLTNEPDKFKKKAEDAGGDRKLGQPLEEPPLKFTSGPPT